MARTVSNDLGDALEDCVATACERALMLRLARVTKVPTPIAQITRVGPAGAFQARHETRAHVDFYGAFLERAGELRGQAIALECKATLEDRFVYSGVRPQQREWLVDTPVAALVVHFAAHNQMRLVWWSDFQPKSSVAPSDGLPVSVATLFDVLAVEARRRLLGP